MDWNLFFTAMAGIATALAAIVVLVEFFGSRRPPEPRLSCFVVRRASGQVDVNLTIHNVADAPVYLSDVRMSRPSGLGFLLPDMRRMNSERLTAAPSDMLSPALELDTLLAPHETLQRRRFRIHGAGSDVLEVEFLLGIEFHGSTVRRKSVAIRRKVLTDDLRSRMSPSTQSE